MTTKSDNKPRFTNIAQIRQANKEAGLFWFSPATIRCFNSRVETRIYEPYAGVAYPQGSRLWVESVQDVEHDQPREYCIARFNLADHDITYVSVDYRRITFPNKVAAVQFLERNLL